MPPRRNKVSRVEKMITAVLLAVAVVVAAAAVAGKNGLLTYIQVDRRYRAMQEEIVRLKDENEKLRKEIQALKTDPETIERVAREKLGMIKPGEVLYRLRSHEEQGRKKAKK